jgi:heptaprenyl diphosphate synthase
MTWTRSSASRETSAWTARIAALVAVGAVLGLVETAMLPGGVVPGVRLGLANLAVVVALVSLGPAAALTVSLARVLVVSLAAGTIGGPGFGLALSGALAAWVAMNVLQRSRVRFSPIGLSIAGAAAHAVAQLGSASLLVGTAAPLGLAPAALGLAAFFGAAIGMLATLVLSRVPSLAPARVGPREVRARGAQASR